MPSREGHEWELSTWGISQTVKNQQHIEGGWEEHFELEELYMSFFYHQAGKKYASLRLDMLYPSRYPPKNPTCQQLMFFFSFSWRCEVLAT